MTFKLVFNHRLVTPKNITRCFEELIYFILAMK